MAREPPESAPFPAVFPRPARPPSCVGFAGERENLLAHARQKLEKKKVPMIVANIGATTFGEDDNAITLVDSAGIRPTDDLIESAGVDLARNALRVCDAIVVVVDGSNPLDECDAEILRDTSRTKRVVAANKCDIRQERGCDHYVPASGEVNRYGTPDKAPAIDRQGERLGNRPSAVSKPTSPGRSVSLHAKVAPNLPPTAPSRAV
jgi:hypothetical protein